MFEPGNQLRLGTKSPKLVQETIKRALAQEDGKRLRQAIEAQLDLAASGDLPALTFIRDTIEGKPAQAVTVSGDEDRPLVSLIKMVVVSTNTNQINTLEHGELAHTNEKEKLAATGSQEDPIAKFAAPTKISE